MKSLAQMPDGSAVFIDANIFVLAGALARLGSSVWSSLTASGRGLSRVSPLHLSSRRSPPRDGERGTPAAPAFSA